MKALVNRKNIIRLCDHLQQGWLKKKFLNLNGRFYHTHTDTPTPFLVLRKLLTAKIFNCEEQVSPADKNFFQSKPIFCKEAIDKLPGRWERIVNNNIINFVIR